LNDSIEYENVEFKKYESNFNFLKIYLAGHTDALQIINELEIKQKE